MSNIAYKSFLEAHGCALINQKKGLPLVLLDAHGKVVLILTREIEPSA